MKRIQRAKMRYGDPEFDRGYIEWGFHDSATRRREAESILQIVSDPKPLRILDLACGDGAHAAFWAGQGHEVLGLDKSEVFIEAARKALAPGASARFCVRDIRDLRGVGVFDLVAWIERSFFDESMCQEIRQVLRDGGLFVTDVRNPDHERTKQRTGDWRTWREETGVYHLERHERNSRTGVHEDVWITIDVDKQEVLEEIADTPAPLSLGEMARMVRASGFQVELRTLENELFTGGSEPYWLWLVARKKEL